MRSQKKDKRAPREKPESAPDKKPKSAYGSEGELAICVNAQCKLRKKGCRGFEGCPGYTSR